MTSYRSPARRKKSVALETGEAQMLAKIGNIHGLEALVAAGGHLDDPDARGDTALLYAVFNNQPHAWKWLLDHGADILHANKKGDTVLHHVAARFSSGEHPLDDLNFLIKRGANLDARNQLGETPVMREANRGERDNDPKRPRDAHLETLAESGADLSIPDLDGNTLADHLGPVVFEWVAKQRVARATKDSKTLEPVSKLPRARIRA